MKPFLHYEQSGAIVTLTMNAAETRNALTGNSAAQEFVDACARIADDTSVRCVILTGAGTVFSSGGNVKDMQSLFDDAAERDPPLVPAGHPAPRARALQPRRADDRRGQRRGDRRRLRPDLHVRHPHRLGDGDVRRELRQGRPHPGRRRRLAAAARRRHVEGGGDVVHRRLADARRRRSPAAWCRAWCRRSGCWTKRSRSPARIAANPGAGLRLTKRLLREGQHTRLESLLEMSAGFQAVAHKTAHHVEAVNAFVEKRKPGLLGPLGPAGDSLRHETGAVALQFFSMNSSCVGM